MGAAAKRLSLIANSCYLRLQSNLGWLTAALLSVLPVIINHSTRSSGLRLLPHQLKCSTCESMRSLAIREARENVSRKIVLRTKSKTKEDRENISIWISLLCSRHCLLFDRSVIQISLSFGYFVKKEFHLIPIQLISSDTI